MAKVQYRRLSHQEQRLVEQNLQETFLKVPRRKQMVEIFLQLLTPSERVMLSRRIAVAKRLMAGESALEIKGELTIGLATIQYVDRWLQENFEDYQSVFPAMIGGSAKKEMSRMEKIPPAPYSFADLRRRYPRHFALVNMLMGES